MIRAAKGTSSDAVDAVDVVVVGIADERFSLFEAACARASIDPPRLISYREATEHLDRHVGHGTVIRFESTDEDPEALRQSLLVGAAIDDPDHPHSQRLSAADVNAHVFQPGQIFAMRQAYLGRCQLWERIEREGLARGARTMNSASALRVTFDKRATIQLLRDAQVAVPRSLPNVDCFDRIVETIHEVPGKQVMVKTAHGAGATGIVALRTDGKRWHASTTAVLEGTSLWNTRNIRTLTDVREIGNLVDVICTQVVHVEQWVPKASMKEGRFDLRVVVIGGVARQVLLRTANAPFTNLHLGAQRGNVQQLRERLGPNLWCSVLDLAERSVAALEGLLYGGVDIVVQSDWKTLVVLEVNGFGDWHPNVLVEGKDTYDWELAALRQTP